MKYWKIQEGFKIGDRWAWYDLGVQQWDTQADVMVRMQELSTYAFNRDTYFRPVYVVEKAGKVVKVAKQ